MGFVSLHIRHAVRALPAIADRRETSAGRAARGVQVELLLPCSLSGYHFLNQVRVRFFLFFSQYEDTNFESCLKVIWPQYPEIGIKEKQAT